MRASERFLSITYDTIGNTQRDKMKRNKFLYYLTICDRTGSLALIRHGTSSIAINTTFGLVPRHLPLGGRHPYGITFRHHQKKNDCFSTNRGGQHELSASDCRKSLCLVFSEQRLTKSKPPLAREVARHLCRDGGFPAPCCPLLPRYVRKNRCE